MKNINKISSHPDKDEIVRRLTEGEPVRSIHKWLSGKYARYSKHLRVSIPTLQNFRSEVLKIDGKVLSDIQKVRKEHELELEKQYIEQQVISTNAYKDKLNQVASTHLDVASKIIQMDAIIGDRMEYWFNMLKSGQEVSTHKIDHELRKYIDQQMVILQQYKKLVEGMADKKVDYNVNITVMNEQMQALQSCIIELVREELDSDKAIDFLNKLNNRLLGTHSVKELPANVKDITFDEVS